jgi:hypothetical protein
MWVNTATRTGSSLPLSSSTCDRRCPQRSHYSSRLWLGGVTQNLVVRLVVSYKGGSAGARRVGKFVHAISSANLRLRGMGIKLPSKSCAWRMQIHLNGLVYCMLFLKPFRTGIYRPVNTLINAHQGPRDDSRASRQFSRAQRSSEVPQRHRRLHHGGTRVKKNQLPWECGGWCPALEYTNIGKKNGPG